MVRPRRFTWYRYGWGKAYTRAAILVYDLLYACHRLVTITVSSTNASLPIHRWSLFHASSFVYLNSSSSHYPGTQTLSLSRKSWSTPQFLGLICLRSIKSEIEVSWVVAGLGVATQCCSFQHKRTTSHIVLDHKSHEPHLPRNISFAPNPILAVPSPHFLSWIHPFRPCRLLIEG